MYIKIGDEIGDRRLFVGRNWGQAFICGRVARRIGIFRLYRDEWIVGVATAAIIFYILFTK